MKVLLHSKSQIVQDLPGFVREGHEGLGPHGHALYAPQYSDADLTAEQAGRLCYLSGHRPSAKTAKNADYLLNICAQKHYSVLGHSFASIYIETSRNTTHETIRHRWFTFSEVSQRYVDADKLGVEMHPGIRQLSDINLYDDALWSYDKSTESGYRAYGDLVESMEKQGASRKEARQAARSVLPGGFKTYILVSGNLRAWRDFLTQRLSPAADEEIREVALEIYKIMKGNFPNSFQDFDSQGMITTERLIKRAQDRRDIALAFSADVKVFEDFSRDVDDILKNGLWILKTDPWEEDKIGSGI